MSSQSAAAAAEVGTASALTAPLAVQQNGDGNPALDRIRQMLLTPPSSRPPEFENPLEKIEQLLTCPICLDRYK
ncbi:unnamed protein product [Enterobius vermicularis]|uniref:Zf-C3HC4 domain-containing protein n=1 Tax=Enterobius vermicularis TaxID=51028 RepID=A0A0N4V5G9_ENTVE|nr:unnamed protein product [Enterobius vermicularis]